MRREYTTLAKVKFSLLNALLSTFLFVLAWKVWLIEYEKTFKTFCIIFLVMALLSWLGAIIARLVSHYWTGREKNSKFYYRTFFITLIYSFLVFSGFISKQFELYPLFPVFTSVDDFIYTENVLARLFIIKLFVMLAADFTAEYYLSRRRS